MDENGELNQLLHRITASRQEFLDPAALRKIKIACRQSHDALQFVFASLMEILGSRDCGQRYKALEVISQLFDRSHLFRRSLVAEFPTFLANATGHLEAYPLPEPQDEAQRLRARALHLLDTWNVKYGREYPSITLGQNYVRRSLRLQNADENRSDPINTQEQRAAEAAQARFQCLLAEWDSRATEFRTLLQHFSDAFMLFEQLRDGTSRLQKGMRGQFADDGDQAIEWEDVDAGGLLLSENADKGQVDAVLDMLSDMHKLIRTQALPFVQEALRKAGRGVEDARRDDLLRSAIDLKNELNEASNRFVSQKLDAAALAQAQARRMVVGSDQPMNPPTSHKAEQAGISEQQKKPNANPYAFIHDPAASRNGNTSVRPPKRPLSLGPTPTPSLVRCEGSTISEEIRASLVARAPVLPAGAFVRVWDSEKNAPQYVSGHGFEVSNHWGPVDAHRQLPADRIDELFLYQPSAQSRNDGDNRRASKIGSKSPAPAHDLKLATGFKERLAGRAQPQIAGNSLHLLHNTSGRAVRAAERAYNDAVISGVQNMASIGVGAPVESGDASNDQTRPPKKRKGSVQNRMMKRLLSGRAMAAANGDIAAAESEHRRDKFANGWENK